MFGSTSNNVIHAERILFPGSTDFTVAIFKIPKISKHFAAMLGTEITSKMMLNLILILILRFAAALYSMVSYNKNMSFRPACLGICGQIKRFGVNIVSTSKTSKNKPVWLISLNRSWKTFLLYNSCIYTTSFYTASLIYVLSPRL